MAEWLALAEVAARPLAGRGFSVHPQGGLDHAGFRVQAAGWRAAFAGQAGQRVAMYFEDAATFAAALFGAWHAGKTPVLCMDALPRTCDELGATVDAFAGDFPDAFSPLAMQAVDDDGGQWPALDEAATRLVLSEGASVALSGGLWLRRAKVMDRWRLEIVGAGAQRTSFVALGCFVEIIAYTPRVFVPTDRPDVLSEILDRWPAQTILPAAA